MEHGYHFGGLGWRHETGHLLFYIGTDGFWSD
jgi:hypothetical protein